MDFNLSEEQQMLQEAVSRWLESDYAFPARKRFLTQGSFVQQNWEHLAELGVLGINVPEHYGGLGGGAVETLIIMQALGRALVLEPFVSSAVVGACLLSRAGSEPQRARWLRGIADGSLRVALAGLERGARFDWNSVGATAAPVDGGHRIAGHKAVVLDGDSARGFIVSARTAGGPDDPEGITLFLVDADAPGVQVAGFSAMDGHRIAEVRFDNVHVDAGAVLGTAGKGLPLLEWGVDHGLAAYCAEAVGAMERLTELTGEYLKSRKQFGQPIAGFQALQHRLADMLIALEQARSLSLVAAAKVNADDPLERRRSLSAAKAMIGRNGRFIGQLAVQLHGGMGMTDELEVGHYFKRLTCIDLTWGDSEHHVEFYGRLL